MVFAAFHRDFFKIYKSFTHQVPTYAPAHKTRAFTLDIARGLCYTDTIHQTTQTEDSHETL